MVTHQRSEAPFDGDVEAAGDVDVHREEPFRTTEREPLGVLRRAGRSHHEVAPCGETVVLDEVLDARVPGVGDEVEVGIDLLRLGARQLVPVTGRIPQTVRPPRHDSKVAFSGKCKRAVG